MPNQQLIEKYKDVSNARLLYDYVRMFVDDVFDDIRKYEVESVILSRMKQPEIIKLKVKHE